MPLDRLTASPSLPHQWQHASDLIDMSLVPINEEKDITATYHYPLPILATSITPLIMPTTSLPPVIHNTMPPHHAPALPVLHPDFNAPGSSVMHPNFILEEDNHFFQDYLSKVGDNELD